MSNKLIHHFNIDDAERYGVHEAIFLFNIRYWIKKNKKTGRHLYEGRYWTYNSVRSFREQAFPYFSDEQIKTIVRNLVKAGILLTSNFNKKGYDKTKWYSINEDDAKVECPQSIDRLITPGPLVESTQPIPDVKADLTPHHNLERKRSSSELIGEFNSQDSDYGSIVDWAAIEHELLNL